MIKSFSTFVRPLPYRQFSDMPLRLRRLHPRHALGLGAITSLTFLIIVIGVYSVSPNELHRKRAIEAFTMLSDEELTRFLKIGLSADDNLRSAIRAAAMRDNEITTDSLAQLVDHPNFLVRIELARALGETGHLAREKGQLAATRLLADQDYLVRSFTAKALAKNDSQESRNMLKRALQEEKHEIVRFAITKALLH